MNEMVFFRSTAVSQRQCAVQSQYACCNESVRPPCRGRIPVRAGRRTVLLCSRVARSQRDRTGGKAQRAEMQLASGQSMTEQEFHRILGFYLACVEAEDRRSRTKRLAALHHSLVSPWDVQEAFFYPENAEVGLEK